MFVPSTRSGTFRSSFFLPFFTLFDQLRKFRPLLWIQQIHDLRFKLVGNFSRLLECMLTDLAEFRLRILKENLGLGLLFWCQLKAGDKFLLFTLRPIINRAMRRRLLAFNHGRGFVPRLDAGNAHTDKRACHTSSEKDA